MPPTKTPSMHPTKGKEYMMLENGSNGCPSGLEIKTKEECSKAIASLNLVSASMWTGAMGRIPPYCSFKEHAGRQKNNAHFNSATKGNGKWGFAPICKKSAMDEVD